MANAKPSGGDKSGAKKDRGTAENVFSDALKEAGQKAAELAQNPVARSMLAAGLGYAFDMMGASVIFGRIPVEDRAARLFTRIIGFRSDGIRPREPDGPLVEWFEMRSAECPPQQL